jgi:WD40 repeat protein
MDWGMKKGLNLELTKNPCAVYGMDFNNDGSKFVVVGKDFHVRVYDTYTKEVEMDFPK